MAAPIPSIEGKMNKRLAILKADIDFKLSGSFAGLLLLLIGIMTGLLITNWRNFSLYVFIAECLYCLYVYGYNTYFWLCRRERLEAEFRHEFGQPSVYKYDPATFDQELKEILDACDASNRK